MQKRKRAPGGGRKPKGDFSELTSPLSIRMPAEMREQLEASASGSGRSVSQEVLRRIQGSFSQDRDRARDPAMRALCFLIAQLAAEVSGLTDEKGQPYFDWRADPFFFRAFKLALAQVLDALEPRGEIRPPKEMLEAQIEVEGNEGFAITKMVKATYETPEARAQAAVRIVLSSLKQPDPPTHRFFEEIAPNFKAKALREYYGFEAARLDLQVKPKPEERELLHLKVHR
jgi:Arc-like DNA binding domain